MNAYTLWLMPDGTAYDKLSRLIGDLSSVHGTPRFEPHVTLLGGITDPPQQAIAKTADLAAQHSSVQASLTEIAYLETFYRCLFFRTDACQPLLSLRTAAEATFQHTPIHPFIPHISFLYGAIPIFKKEAIIAELKDSFLMDLHLSSLWLVETSRTPDHWKLLASFDLGS